jgi:serine/threonine protein kinase/HEAT repeat protein
MPDGAAGRICPRCAAAFLKAAPTEMSGGSADSPRPFTPPPVAELEPLFPQLEILELIGQGGMGAVYKARQKELDRIVALKILPPGVGDAGFAERFAREAKALARLNHPGIVTIYEFGRSNGLFFFLMEFVDGVTLRQLLATSHVSPREALAIVPAICDALQYAHDQGIVHRDIKPENILLDRRGRTKVADFGLAKLMENGGAVSEFEAATPGVSATVTHASKVMGTPQYMAPEQVEHPATVDHRADIYALGVVFYQMLTGELPGQRVEAPSTKVRIDVRLDEVVLRALEKEPERRYQQVSQVKTAVETILQTEAPEPLKAEAGLAEQATSSQARPSKRTPLGVAAGVVVALAIWFCWHLLSKPPGSLGEIRNVSATTVRTGDIGVQVGCLGNVESSNSVMFAIPESYCKEVIRKFDAHQALTVEASNGQGEKFGHGFLSGVDNLIDTSTGMLKCKATLFPEGENLMVSGLFLNISLLLEVNHNVTLVPTEAVCRMNPESPFVWAIQTDHTVTQCPVRVGTTDGDWTEIQSGVSPGEVVVSRGGGGFLHEGQKIRFDLAPKAESAQPPGQNAAKTIEWLKIQPVAGWISDLQNPDQKVQKMAERVLTELGTNAVPEVLKILSDTSDSSVEGGTHRYNTAQALKFMGPGVKSSLPAFALLVKSGQQASAYAGAEALAFSAPAVPEAFSILTNGLTDLATGVRDAASHGVELCLNTDSNSFAEPALPLLVRNLSDKADYVRADSAVALMMYAQRQRQHWPPREAKPDLLIPPLIELLRDKYSFTREYAADALTFYGERIKPWIPTIQKLLSDPDDGVRRSAAHLLQGLNATPATYVIPNDSRTHSISIDLSGSNPLSYQWQFDPTNGADATNATPK